MAAPRHPLSEAAPAADVQVLDRESGLARLVDKGRDLANGLGVPFGLRNLAADVYVYAHQPQVFQFADLGQGAPGPCQIDTELVLALACGDVLVGAGVNVRVDAQGNRRLAAAFARYS